MGYFWKGGEGQVIAPPAAFVCDACARKVFQAAGKKWLEDNPGQMPALYVNADFDARTATVGPNEPNAPRTTYTFAELDLGEIC